MLLKKNYIIIFLISIFFASCNGNNSNSSIGIQVFGNFSPSLIDTIERTIFDVYGFEATVLTPRELPKSAFVNIKSPRYRADSIIRILKEDIPDSIDHVLGLIDKDISTTKRDKFGNIKKPESKYTDWGIFGLGYRPGPSCIVSIYRLRHKDREKFMSRFKKVSIHELGHNLGLKHCDSDENCVMRDAAETIKTIDHVDLSLCTSCKEKIN